MKTEPDQAPKTTWLRKILGIERRAQQRRISAMFSRYLDPEEVARLVKEKEATEKIGKNKGEAKRGRA